MSTPLLYHGFNVRGYELVEIRSEDGAMLLVVRQKDEDLRCPVCHSRHVIRRGCVPRAIRTVPIGSTPVKILLDVPRLACRDCNRIRQASLRFAQPRRSYCETFERHAVELSRRMTLQDVAQHLNVGWDLVKDIVKRSLEKRYKKIRLRDLRQIAIDEICIGSGHNYVTVVLDLLSGAVVHVGDGKGGDALKSFWKRLHSAHAKIEAVAMDMSPAYLAAVVKHLPQAVIVFDHFHVIKLYQEKLSQLRRDLYREATELLHKKVLKGTRWLLLKNPDHLDESKDEPRRLREALALNEPLALAYYMKEDLRQVWRQASKRAAKRLLTDWIRRAERSGIAMLSKFAKTLGMARNQILAYYDYRISTGPLEGTNNKIRVLQRDAYGFRDKEFFKLRIYALHELKFKLVG